MPRFEYRDLRPTAAAEKTYLQWIDQLDREFINRDPEHRSNIVRDALEQIYIGRAVSANGTAEFAAHALVHSLDPRNVTLEPEYYGDVDATRYAERKPLIWFWMMFDISVVFGFERGVPRIEGMRKRPCCEL